MRAPLAVNHDRIGGFPEQPCLEDLELALRLREAGKLIDAGAPVTSTLLGLKSKAVRSGGTMSWFDVTCNSMGYPRATKSAVK